MENASFRERNNTKQNTGGEEINENRDERKKLIINKIKVKN